MQPSASLALARVGFAVLGVVAILAAAGQLYGGLSGGARLDWIIVAWALATGIGALAAALWVLAAGTLRMAVAWAGIAVVLFTSLVPIYILIDSATPGPDVIALAVIPTLIGLLASARMARARWVAGFG